MFTSLFKPSILKPSGGLYLNSMQSGIPNFTETLVLLDAISSGFTDGIEDTGNHKITPGVAGLYLLTAQIAYRQLTTGSNYCQLVVKLNGATDLFYQYKQIAFGTSTSNLTIAGSKVVSLSNTDYINMYALHDCGNADPDVMPGEDFTFLQLQLLRKA